MIRTAVFAIAGVVLGASGDIIYQSEQPTVEITAAQALPFAQQAITVGSWDGVASDIIRVEVWREPGPDGVWKTADDEFKTQSQGMKTIAPTSLSTVNGGGAVQVIGHVP